MKNKQTAVLLLQQTLQLSTEKKSHNKLSWFPQLTKMRNILLQLFSVVFLLLPLSYKIKFSQTTQLAFNTFLITVTYVEYLIE